MVLNGKAFPSLTAFAALPRFILYLSLSALLFKRISPAATCFPKASRLSIIGRMCLYRRVRDGYGCFPLPHHHRTYSFLKANKRLTHKTLLTPLRKEVIQPHLPIRLPCYDFTPVTGPAVDCSLLTVGSQASGVTGSHGVTGGVYKTRELIHRSMLICDY